MSLLNAYANFVTKKNKESYDKAIKQAIMSSLMMQMTFGSNQDNPIPIIEHPLHKPRLEQYKIDIAKNLPRTKGVTVNFGDSVTDLSRKYLSDSIDGIYSISGSYANHMSQMAEDLKPLLINYDIKYICVGTLGGNPMLVYRNYPDIVLEARKALNIIRGLYPSSRIIIYTIPPTFNLFANSNAYRFTGDMLAWANSDKNSIVIDLHSNLGNGPLNLFPSSEWSSDGVHLSPSGARKLSSMINKAKTFPGKLLV